MSGVDLASFLPSLTDLVQEALDARSTAAKIEELSKLGGKENEIAEVMKELAGIKKYLPGIMNQLQQLLHEEFYEIGTKSTQVRDS
jgi:Asp-tRNA(Asn)/Glu-tRNA(Gln) amidotransferase C subunit